MKSLISRNPQIQFGAYCIRGTRIPVKAIRGMYKAGDSSEYIRKSYNLSQEQMEAALHFREHLNCEEYIAIRKE